VTDPEQARALAALHGATGLAGDLNIDGSIGSHTALLREPYVDDPGCRGSAYRDVASVRDHVAACAVAGVQSGFHVIGDAGLDLVLEGYEAAGRLVGVDLVRASRPRLEHAEMVDAHGIGRMARLGIRASVQPAFDAAWGGENGMYVSRLGAERAEGCNPFAELADEGVALALGSDAPVTPMDPWGGVHAAVDHRTAASGMRPFDAFDAATHGGWYAARAEHPGGPLAVGAVADLALWATPQTLSAVLDARTRPTCRLLVVDGEPIGSPS
jgi:predicted amidohydrolase YtcJ